MTKFQDEFSKELWDTTYKYYKDTTVDESFRRVAKHVATAEKNDIEKWENEFYNILVDFQTTMGGRIYSNAGTDLQDVTLFNCYVSPKVENPDSLTGILKLLSDQSKTLKSEGGWGNNFSAIRPRGAYISGIGSDSPGVVSFMELFDKSSEIITSGSGKKSTNKKAKKKIRKGAMMGVLDATHPSIFEFINAKLSQGKLSKFNLSVNFPNNFMDKLINVKKLKKEGSDYTEENKWDLIFPDTKFKHYDTEWDGNIQNWKFKNYPIITYETTTVEHLWDVIIKSTYTRNEPGVLFLDRANENNPFYYGETIRSTNPCGEVPLPEAGVCNLGSVNLTQYLTDDGIIDFNKLKTNVFTLVRLLDNINDVSNFPLEEYKQTAQNKRRVGLGVLGWGSLLYMMKIKFGSNEASILRDKLLKCIYRSAYECSIDLAIEKGMFIGCDPIKHANGKFVKRLGLSDEYMTKLKNTGIRNSTLGAIAPNGNTSIFANIVSGGLEPIFMPEYIRTVIVNAMPEEIEDVCPKWFHGEWHETSLFKFTKEGDEDILKGVHDGITYKIDKNRGLTKEVLCEDYGVRWLKSRDEWNSDADWAVSTENLSVEEHLNDLTGFAKYIDQSCSKTINIPNEYDYLDFENVYIDAYNSEYIKGVTTYRAGTMTSVLSSNEYTEEEEIILDHVKMPDSSPASIKILKCEGRKWYLTVVLRDDNMPFALFVKTNSTEKTINTINAIDVLTRLAQDKGIPVEHIDSTINKIKSDSNSSKITRIISLLLRHGVLIKNIVLALDTIEDVFVGSFLFQIKKFLASYIKDGEKVTNSICQSCGSEKIVFSEGCQKCNDCGSSLCG